MPEKATLMFQTTLSGAQLAPSQGMSDWFQSLSVGFFKDWHPDSNQTKGDQHMFSKWGGGITIDVCSPLPIPAQNTKTDQPTKSYFTGQQDTLWEKEFLWNPPASVSPVAGLTDIFHLIMATMCLMTVGLEVRWTVLLRGQRLDAHNREK